jgi:hypothetical protein
LIQKFTIAFWPKNDITNFFYDENDSNLSEILSLLEEAASSQILRLSTLVLNNFFG